MSNNVLIHFGVKGMRWGVRKKEEPLSDEQKAALRKKLIVAGSIATGVILAAGITYASVKYHQKAKIGRQLIEEDLLKRLPGKWSEISWKKDSKLSELKDLNSVMEKVVKPINPNYGEPGTTNNCVRASFAYELRRRGYNVRSTLSTDSDEQSGLARVVAMGLKEKSQIFGENNIKTFLTDSPAKQGRMVFDALNKYPVGARGELAMHGIFNGHSVAWEKFNDGVAIIDAQTNKRFVNPDFFGINYFRQMENVSFTRLDDKVLDFNMLSRWVTDAIN